MNRFLIAGGLIAAMALVAFRMPAKEPVDLEDAIKKGMVKIEPVSKGGYSGDCINLKLTNLSKGELNLVLPAGSVFHPEDDGMQDIFVPQDQLFVLEKGKTLQRPVRGYCCQASDRSPSSGTTFRLAKSKNPKLQELASFLKKNRFSDHITQSAVWCVSDDHNVSGIYHSDRSKVQPLRDVLCKLTGQKDVWYSTDTDHVMDDDGYIRCEPKLITGAIKCKADAPVGIRAEVKGVDVEREYKIPGELKLPRAGEFEYDFNLRISGWQKGKYQVLIFAGDKKIHTQDFEL